MPAVIGDPEDDESDLVRRARSGDRDALGQLLERLRTPLFRLATSMFWDRADAEDATQEALIAVMTHLGSFRGDARLSTWSYRIAVRLYLRRRRSATEQAGLTLDRFAADLLDGLADGSAAPDAELLAEEVRVGCTLGVLQCLDREDRVTFVLGDVFALPGQAAADILGLTHEAYRKRLSRVRSVLRSFVRTHCGVVNADAACRCAGRVDRAVAGGRLRPGSLRFVTDRTQVIAATAQIAGLHDTAALFRAAGLYEAPPELAARVLHILDRPGPLLEDATRGQPGLTGSGVPGAPG